MVFILHTRVYIVFMSNHPGRIATVCPAKINEVISCAGHAVIPCLINDSFTIHQEIDRGIESEEEITNRAKPGERKSAQLSGETSNHSRTAEREKERPDPRASLLCFIFPP